MAATETEVGGGGFTYDPSTTTINSTHTVHEPGGPCHVVDLRSSTGTLCGYELPPERARNTHYINSCPRNGGGRCVLCPDCERLLGQGQ